VKSHTTFKTQEALATICIQKKKMVMHKINNAGLRLFGIKTKKIDHQFNNAGL
jgi:hypothetical protein